MNVKITSFVNPFSFFCLPEEGTKNLNITVSKPTSHKSPNISHIENPSHGQYVAVMWKDQWVRGVVSTEHNFVIWLIDYGVFLNPSEKNVFVDLPIEHRSHPTKVFEASIHGVVPVLKVVNEELIINTVPSTAWNDGAVQLTKKLIMTATSVFFIPICILTTRNNDVVLGDLYIKLPDREFVNIIDELREWPVHLKVDKEAYIKGLPKMYTSRRKHRVNYDKPVFPDITLPSITMNCSIEEYDTLCRNALVYNSNDSCPSECGSTVLDKDVKSKKIKKITRLTPQEIEKYSEMFIRVGERQYNVLNVLLHKIRDLNMCERYKDYDKKSLGRANNRAVYK